MGVHQRDSRGHAKSVGVHHPNSRGIATTWCWEEEEEEEEEEDL